MTVMNAYAPGQFCWVDLATPNVVGAKQFYTAVFGWSYDDVPCGPDRHYSKCLVDGRDVAALYQRDIHAGGAPVAWVSYVSVADMDRCVARVCQLGGRMLVAPMEIADVGRLAMVQDPIGALVGLWQPGSRCGAQLVNEPGALCWNELQTRDCAQAEAFYRGLFGWRVQRESMDNGYVYTTFYNGKRMNSGMLVIRPEWGDMPDHWAVFFAVQDCDAGVEKTVESGGKALTSPRDIPGIGRFAVLQDPYGAAFSVIRLEHPN